jgi:hypothetical protein
MAFPGKKLRFELADAHATALGASPRGSGRAAPRARVVMRPSVHACLRNALKFTTWVLLVTGLAIALVAGFLLLEFERARDAADAPAPPPPTPPPAPGLPEAPPTSEIARALATEPWYDRVPHRRVSWSISSPLFRARREHHVKDSLFPVTPDTETRLGVFVSARGEVSSPPRPPPRAR